MALLCEEATEYVEILEDEKKLTYKELKKPLWKKYDSFKSRLTEESNLRAYTIDMRENEFMGSCIKFMELIKAVSSVSGKALTQVQL